MEIFGSTAAPSVDGVRGICEVPTDSLRGGGGGGSNGTFVLGVNRGDPAREELGVNAL